MLKAAILNETDMADVNSFRDMHPSENKFLYIKGRMQVAGIEVEKIHEVNDPFLYAAFALNKEYNSKVATVKTLYYATQRHCMYMYLDWRLSTRCTYGYGLHFSPDPAYAHLICKRDDDNVDDQKAMIVFEVICNKVSISNNALKIPPKGYDTTQSFNGKVLVKYNDDEFYPRYVAYYTAK